VHEKSLAIACPRSEFHHYIPDVTAQTLRSLHVCTLHELSDQYHPAPQPSVWPRTHTHTIPCTTTQFIDRVNAEYETVHLSYEEQFWGTKMALKEPPNTYTTEQLGATKAAMETFLGQPGLLKECQAFLDGGKGSESQEVVLALFKVGGCMVLESERILLSAHSLPHTRSLDLVFIHILSLTLESP
jgi:hypothetical protein